ncbi:unnamed protein product [Sphagnum jensenii]|uniref:Secreted protein n=1 Tax=Sphagnum jensenii TaxID=128206 RepID=A0ABP1BSB2_9BRYO
MATRIAQCCRFSFLSASLFFLFTKKKLLLTFCFLSYFERGCFEQKHIVISGNHIDRRFRTPVVFLLAAGSDNANKSIISSSFLENERFDLWRSGLVALDLSFFPQA